MEQPHEVRLAADLIRAHSPSGAEGPATGVLIDAMRELGFDEVFVDPAGNAVGRFVRGAGPHVMLNGHLDTVPLGDESLWPYPPLSGAVEGGMLWGRGASDMKSSLACMVVAARDAANSGFSGTLSVAGVVLEEVGGLGARYLAENSEVDVVVLGEPSSLRLKLGHRGAAGVEVTFPGAIAHAAKAELGENALVHAARYIAALGAMPLPTGGTLKGSSATPTRLETFPQGGTNVVPGSAKLYVDYRNVPGDELDHVVARLEAIRHDERITVKIPEQTLTSVSGEVSYTAKRAGLPYLLDEGHEAVAAARRALTPLLARHGRELEVGYWWFCTDAPHLASRGAAVLGFGPGAEELAHTTRECVPVESLAVAREAYRALSLELLGPA